MINHEKIQREVGSRLFRDFLELMFRYACVRFIFDSFDLTPIFQFADNAPKIDDCSRAKIDNLVRRFQSLFCQ